MSIAQPPASSLDRLSTSVVCVNVTHVECSASSIEWRRDSSTEYWLDDRRKKIDSIADKADECFADYLSLDRPERIP